jgi:transcriptional regulator with XRE-family HTH domain
VVDEQLRDAIRKRGHSLHSLAKASGVDSGRLSRFTRGHTTLYLSAAGQICNVLGLTLTPRQGPDKRRPS